MKGSKDNKVFRRLYRARAARRTDSMCQSTRAWNMWSVILPLEPKRMVTPVHGRLVPSSASWQRWSLSIQSSASCRSRHSPSWQRRCSAAWGQSWLPAWECLHRQPSVPRPTFTSWRSTGSLRSCRPVRVKKSRAVSLGTVCLLHFLGTGYEIAEL